MAVTPDLNAASLRVQRKVYSHSPSRTSMRFAPPPSSRLLAASRPASQRRRTRGCPSAERQAVSRLDRRSPWLGSATAVAARSARAQPAFIGAWASESIVKLPELPAHAAFDGQPHTAFAVARLDRPDEELVSLRPRVGAGEHQRLVQP